MTLTWDRAQILRGPRHAKQPVIFFPTDFAQNAKRSRSPVHCSPMASAWNGANCSRRCNSRPRRKHVQSSVRLRVYFRVDPRQRSRRPVQDGLKNHSRSIATKGERADSRGERSSTLSNSSSPKGYVEGSTSSKVVVRFAISNGPYKLR